MGAGEVKAVRLAAVAKRGGWPVIRGIDGAW